MIEENLASNKEPQLEKNAVPSINRVVLWPNLWLSLRLIVDGVDYCLQLFVHYLTFTKEHCIDFDNGVHVFKRSF